MVNPLPIPLALQAQQFIKVGPQSKIPTESQWQNHPYSAEEISDWILNGNNYGVLPVDLLIIDIDNPQRLHELNALAGIEDTLTVSTSKGFHKYFRLKDGFLPPKRLTIEDPISGNQIADVYPPGCPNFVVGPGSVHPNGIRYAVVQDLPPREISLTELDRAFFSKVKSKRFEDKVPAKKRDIRRESLTDILDLRIENFCRPNKPRTTSRGGLQGSHPVHGSSTGHNLVVSPDLNLAYCFRHNVAFDPVKWVAVQEGHIQCSDAENPLSKEVFQRVKDWLRAHGYEEQIKEHEADIHEDTEGKNKVLNKSFFEIEGSLYFTVIDRDENYTYCHLDKNAGRLIFDSEIAIDKWFYRPPTLPKKKDGSTAWVVKIPKRETLESAKLLNPGELYDLLKEHHYKYCDCQEMERELDIYFDLFTWFYSKCNTTPYRRYIGDTGTGKSRLAKVNHDLCFFPITAEGMSTVSGIMRFKEQWNGTLRIDEADLRGGSDNSLIKYLNLGFEKDHPYLLTDPNNLNKIDVFDPFCPKIIAMRNPFKDNATEARCLSYTPDEMTRDDIPVNLPDDYYVEVEKLQAHIGRFVLEYWDQVSSNQTLDLSDREIEPRLRQIATPISVILSLFPDGEKRFIDYIEKRQLQLKKSRSESFEGILFNTVYNIARGDLLVKDQYSGLAVTAQMIEDHTGIRKGQITQKLRSIGISQEKRRVTISDPHGNEQNKQIRIIIVPNKKKWREMVQRYYYDESLSSQDYENIQCPDILQGQEYEKKFLDNLGNYQVSDTCDTCDSVEKGY